MSSYCQESGKDKIIVLSKEDYMQPINTKLAEIQVQEDDEEGLIKANGEINWGCPCLGGMATGPCGQEFREAFSCFHYSTEEMKGSDCVEKFQKMSECMSQYPELYPEAQDDDEDDSKDLSQYSDVSSKQEQTSQQKT